MAGSPLKKARRQAAVAKPIDPLDEAPPRPALGAIPWNKVSLSEAQRAAVAAALADRRTRNEVAAALGVSVTTLRRIIKDDPALIDAMDAADEAELAEIRTLLMEHGRAGDTVALIFLGKAFHGLRDRDDGKVRVEGGSGGVLVVPGIRPLDEWTLAAARQQAPHRERTEFEPSTSDMRTPRAGLEGLVIERTLPGNLKHSRTLA
ncbi:MAG: hypothetical protein B7Z08_04840 [Sphingomonadales bacterium 32-68-7]|nr:MAG: hypothetical protein B7Z33_08905 [Sphingomonadales bacterium 12-68-11]OYX09561.1 MAG: hypothetical protein B7Z08_04840 [Sphingomonadales bacterium 32-68-7]